MRRSINLQYSFWFATKTRYAKPQPGLAALSQPRSSCSMLFEEALGGEKAWFLKEFFAERQRAVSAGETEPRFREKHVAGHRAREASEKVFLSKPEAVST